MDADRFDRLVRASGAVPRRPAMRAAAAAALAGLFARLGTQDAAAGCRRAGHDCRRSTQCCSGRCRGKRGEKTCRTAFSQGTCSIRRDICLLGDATAAVDCGVTCRCYVTTAGASFCGQPLDFVADCAACPTGTRCMRQGPACPSVVCTRPCPE